MPSPQDPYIAIDEEGGVHPRPPLDGQRPVPDYSARLAALSRDAQAIVDRTARERDAYRACLQGMLCRTHKLDPAALYACGIWQCANIRAVLGDGGRQEEGQFLRLLAAIHESARLTGEYLGVGPDDWKQYEELSRIYRWTGDALATKGYAIAPQSPEPTAPLVDALPAGMERLIITHKPEHLIRCATCDAQAAGGITRFPDTPEGAEAAGRHATHYHDPASIPFGITRYVAGGGITMLRCEACRTAGFSILFYDDPMGLNDAKVHLMSRHNPDRIQGDGQP